MSSTASGSPPYASLQTDVRNAGGSWVDEEVVTDDVDGWTLVTSRTPDDLDAFLREVDNALLGPRPLILTAAEVASGRQQGSQRVEGRLDVGGRQRPEPDHEAVAHIGGVVVPAQRADEHPTGDRLTGLDGESAVDHDGDVQTGGARQQAGALAQPPEQPVDQQRAPLAVHPTGPAEVAVELAALDEGSERLLGRLGRAPVHRLAHGEHRAHERGRSTANPTRRPGLSDLENVPM